MMMDHEYLLKGEEIYPKVENTNKSLAQMLVEKLVRFPNDKISSIDALTKETITYHEVLHKAATIAKDFRSLGATKGDVVLLLMDNNIHYGCYVLGSLIAETILCPCNPNYTTYELRHICSIIQPKIVVSCKMSMESIQELQEKFNFRIVEVSHDKMADDWESQKIYESLDRNHNGDDAVFILCSSGTTGLAKGVVHTNSSMKQSLYILSGKQMNARKEDVLLAYLPFFHLMGIATLLGNMYCEQKLIVLSKFKPQLFLHALEEYKINKMYIVPTVGLFLAEYPDLDHYDLSNLTEVICAGSKLDSSAYNKLTKRLKIDVRVGYGMSEINYTTVTPPHNKKITSVGKLLPGYVAKVMDPETKVLLPPFQTGELLIKSKCNFIGYYNNNNETLSTIREDGFVHTGDMVYYDDAGYIYIVDRLKELIKHKSFQVSPTELEAILLKHECVQDVAVVGIPDCKYGELPRAYVVLRDDNQATKGSDVDLAQELKDFLAGHVSAYKRLTGGVRFVDQIPKNPSGKILRRFLIKKDMMIQEEKKL